MTVEQVAEICHQANKTHCSIAGDFTHKNWKDSEQSLKDSVINGVKYKLTNPEVTPEDSHNNWLKFKEAEGYVYGEVKDIEKKTHPCFLPYEQLPLHDRIKDYLFTSIVKSLSKFVK